MARDYDRKTFSEIYKDIMKYWKVEFENGNITRGFFTKQQGINVRLMIAEHYDLNKFNIRIFRDHFVLAYSFKNKEYDLIKADCMSAITHMCDDMLFNLESNI